jgi:hypothetical protein
LRPWNRSFGSAGIIVQCVGFADVQICTFPSARIRGKFGDIYGAQQKKEPTGMKKPSSKIREEIARLQDQLKIAETREAERIGRIALKAGLGEIDIEEAALQAAFENIADGFRTGKKLAPGKNICVDSRASGGTSAAVASDADTGSAGEA